VGSVCQRGGGPVQAPRTQHLDLGDGTFIFEGRRGCFRARIRQCRTKCLPPDTLVATPSGELPIRDIVAGMLVWTQDSHGAREARPVIDTATIAIQGSHDVALIRLEDGRSLTSSLLHPVLGGRLIADLSRGDLYDASPIADVTVLPYAESHTHDILPAGDTGVYWANGIPVGSTLTVTPLETSRVGANGG